MAQRQITELPTATTPDGSELLLVRQDVYDKKLDVNSLLAYLQSVLDDRYLNESLNLSDVDAIQAAFDNIKQSATESYDGVVELATVAEAIDGVDTTRAVTPKGLYEAILQNVPAASYTQSGKVELATPNETKTGTDGTRAVTPAGIKAILDDMFVGQVAAFAMGVAPEGWLKCNGATVSRTTYAKLFAKIGTTYGSGNGSTTFNLPDLRGEFVRGFDDGRSVDSNRTLGSYQNHQVQKHNHYLPTTTGNPAPYWGITDSVWRQSSINLAPAAGYSATTYPDDRYEAGSAVGNIPVNMGQETRPRNVALLYCIKY